MGAGRAIAGGLLVVLLLGTGSALAGGDLHQQVRDLGGSDAKRRSAAYRALAEALDPAALPLLGDAIPRWDHTGRRYGLLVIDRYPFRQARRTWRALASADAPFVRLWAATALLLGGEKGQVEIIVRALHAPDVKPVVRIRMLGRLGWADEPELREAVRALLAPTTDLPVLAEVVALLHDVRDRAARERLEALLAALDPDRRGLAAALLYDLGDLRRAAVVAASLERGMGPVAFSKVATILSPDRHVADEILDAATERMAKEKSPSLLLALIRFVGDHRHARARETLRGLLGHADRHVARAAFDVLVTLSGPLREDTLRPLLEGPDRDKRLWAAEALRRRDDLEGLPAVIDALRLGTVPQRTQAVRLLGTFVTDEAVEPLIDALVDDHVEVRRTAAASLAKLLDRLFPYRAVELALAGYHPNVEVRERHAAAQRLRAWWATAKGADW